MSQLWFSKRHRKNLEGDRKSSMVFTAADSGRQAHRIDWSSKAVFVAEVASNVGDMRPCDYLKGVAGLVLTLIRPF